MLSNQNILDKDMSPELAKNILAKAERFFYDSDDNTKLTDKQLDKIFIAHHYIKIHGGADDNKNIREPFEIALRAYLLLEENDIPTNTGAYQSAHNLREEKIKKHDYFHYFNKGFNFELNKTPEELKKSMTYYGMALQCAKRMKNYENIVEAYNHIHVTQLQLSQREKSNVWEEKSVETTQRYNDAKVVFRKINLLTDKLEKYHTKREKGWAGTTLFGGYKKSQKLSAVKDLIKILNGDGKNLKDEHIGPLTQGDLGKIIKTWVNDNPNLKSTLPPTLVDALTPKKKSGLSMKR